MRIASSSSSRTRLICPSEITALRAFEVRVSCAYLLLKTWGRKPFVDVATVSSCRQSPGRPQFTVDPAEGVGPEGIGGQRRGFGVAAFCAYERGLLQAFRSIRNGGRDHASPLSSAALGRFPGLEPLPPVDSLDTRERGSCRARAQQRTGRN